jgi:SAM-dependent methyltransferase
VPSVSGLDEAEASRGDSYDRAYTAVLRDGLLLDVHRQALGDEYPEGIEVTGSCTRTMLERALAGLRLPEDGLLADLGCGLGGPGRWLARRGRARLIGFDVSQAAVDSAAGSAREYLEDGRFEYRRGSFAATGLPDACADGVVAIESLQMATDRGAALREVRRILRPGGRAVITAAERRADNGPDAFRWAPLIEQAGLEITASYDDPRRGERWLAFCALQLEHAAELRDSLGDMAEEFLEDARNAPSVWDVPGLTGVQFIVRRHR